MVRIPQKEKNLIYFVTFTCHNWLPLFEITNCYDAIYKWFDYLKTKGHQVTGYVIMPNHFHGLIYVSPHDKTINTIIGNSKRFLAYEIVKRLEAKEEWDLLKILHDTVPDSERKKGKKHQVFEYSFDAKAFYYEDFILQKLNYMHQNPITGKWKLVENFVDYPHSSARF
ncbi:MAG: hypothetical protein P1U70_20715 [Saprospiraceae bacterium]|jgi:REP element-mobilizing transposase RayT|nr:hypothetical protein [Saprospiraceae bacterium]